MSNRFERFTKGPIKNALKNADALVVTEGNNIFLTSDVVPATLQIIPDRLLMPVFIAEGDPFWVVADITEKTFRNVSKYIKNFVIYHEFKTSPIEALVGALKKRGFKHKRILVEKNNLVVNYYDELQKLLPGIEIADATPILNRMRMIKTPEEQFELQKRANLTLRAIKRCYLDTKIGDTEIQIQSRAISYLVEEGFDTVAFLTLARGRADALNVKPSEAKLELGDMLRIDTGGIMKGWRSDISRTAVAGKPSVKQMDYYKKNREVHYKIIETMQPGNIVADTYNFCINEYPKYRMHCDMPHIGHGIGAAQHEMPIISPFFKDVYEPGMIFMLEPMGIAEDVGGFFIEDMILITEKGPKLLSDEVGSEEMTIIE
jgi:Xaa-Pro aminopeptidase